MTRPLSTPVPQRNHLTFQEVLTRWNWEIEDLKEAVLSGQLTPSLYEISPLWPLHKGASGKRQHNPTEPAFVPNRWMYVVGVKPTGPFDCKFTYLADRPKDIDSDNPVYKRVGNGYKDLSATLSDVIERGGFHVQEVERYESSFSTPPAIPSTPNTTNAVWWSTEYNVEQLAKDLEATFAERGWGLNARGRRAGKAPLRRISEEVAVSISKSESSANRERKIGAKSIENFLRKSGWK